MPKIQKPKPTAGEAALWDAMYMHAVQQSRSLKDAEQFATLAVQQRREALGVV